MSVSTRASRVDRILLVPILFGMYDVLHFSHEIYLLSLTKYTKIIQLFDMTSPL